MAENELHHDAEHKDAEPVDETRVMDESPDQDETRVMDAPTRQMPQPAAGPVPTEPMTRIPPEAPRPAHEQPAPAQDVPAGLKRLRIAVGVLAAVVVALAIAFGAFAVWSSARMDALQNRLTALEVEVTTELAGQQGNGSSNREDKDDAETNTAARLRAADIVDIVGEKWSNALNILDTLGVDSADLVLITSDGKEVYDPANWTVTLVSDLKDEGKVAVHLRHDVESFWDWLW